MKYAYIASDNSAGDAQVLGEAGRDIVVKKVVFGVGADGKITHFYNKRVAGGHASGMGSVSTDSLAFKFTQATAAAGKDWVREIDFTAGGKGGLQLDGGACHTNDAQVLILWDYADEDN